MHSWRASRISELSLLVQKAWRKRGSELGSGRSSKREGLVMAWRTLRASEVPGLRWKMNFPNALRHAVLCAGCTLRFSRRSRSLAMAAKRHRWSWGPAVGGQLSKKVPPLGVLSSRSEERLLPFTSVVRRNSPETSLQPLEKMRTTRATFPGDRPPPRLSSVSRWRRINFCHQ